MELYCVRALACMFFGLGMDIWAQIGRGKSEQAEGDRLWAPTGPPGLLDGMGGGDRPKYIMCNYSICLVWENGILSIRLQFTPLCFRHKEKLQTLKKGHNSKYGDLKISDYSRVVRY